MRYIGIDPGKKGGIAVIDTELDTEVFPMPPNYSLADFLEKEKRGRCHVFIEKAQAMPTNGAVSMFNYGQHFGEIVGMLIAFHLPYTLVPPRTWTKVMHAGIQLSNADAKQKGAPKKKSLIAVRRLFPHVNLVPPGKRVEHDGVIDALLIAEYGRRTLKQ